jgi:hypothetical protein
LPLAHPAFEALQLLSVRGVVRRYPDRTVRRDAPLTPAAAAVLLNRYFDAWPSVSGVHFADVQHTHWAFRDVETLHDKGLLGILGLKPLWPDAGGYQGPQHAGFARPESRRAFQPDSPLEMVEWQRLLEGFGVRLRQRTTEPQVVTRAAAAIDLLSLDDHDRQ